MVRQSGGNPKYPKKSINTCIVADTVRRAERKSWADWTTTFGANKKREEGFLPKKTRRTPHTVKPQEAREPPGRNKKDNAPTQNGTFYTVPPSGEPETPRRSNTTGKQMLLNGERLAHNIANLQTKPVTQRRVQKSTAGRKKKLDRIAKLTLRNQPRTNK